MSGGDPDAFVPLARALSDRGEYEQASEVAHRGLLTRPDSIEGRLTLAAAEDKQGRVREAMEQIKRALLIDPDHVEALVLMGRILVDRGMPDRALQFLTHAAEKDPDHPAVTALRERARASTVGTFPAQRPEGGGSSSPWGEEHTVLAGNEGPSTTPPRGLAGLESSPARKP
ncbi:MAG: tetratricopeptide repeat protein, partial [Myxococcota bacterium]